MKKVFLLLFFLLVLCSFAFAADRSSSWVRPISPSGNITYTNVTNINGTNCSVTGSCHNITYLDYDNAGALRVDTIRLDNGWIYDGAGNQVFEGSNGIAKLGNSFNPTGYTTAFYGNVNGSNKNITNAGTIKANLFDGSMDCSNITSATSNLCTIEPSEDTTCNATGVCSGGNVAYMDYLNLGSFANVNDTNLSSGALYVKSNVSQVVIGNPSVYGNPYSWNQPLTVIGNMELIGGSLYFSGNSIVFGGVGTGESIYATNKFGDTSSLVWETSNNDRIRIANQGNVTVYGNFQTDGLTTTGQNLTMRTEYVVHNDSYALEMPNNKGVNNVFNMTGNVLLMHMNNDWDDYSGLGNDGSAKNGIFTTSSKLGSHAGSFNYGLATNYINVTGTSISPTNEISFGAWVYVIDNTNMYQCILLKPFPGAAGGNEQYHLLANGNVNGVFCAGIKIGSSMKSICPSASIINITSVKNKWTHLMVTYNGSTMRFYANGVFISDNNFTGIINTTTYPLGIGGTSNPGYHGFNGSIDEVAIWNRSLSPTEIQRIYNYSRGWHEVNVSTANLIVEGERLDLMFGVNNTEVFFQNGSGGYSAIFENGIGASTFTTMTPKHNKTGKEKWIELENASTMINNETKKIKKDTLLEGEEANVTINNVTTEGHNVDAMADNNRLMIAHMKECMVEADKSFSKYRDCVMGLS